MECALCERVRKTHNREYPYLIHEFDHSYLMLGEHQFYNGYCVLVSKEHFREMTDLPSVTRGKLFAELMIAHQAIQNVFAPKKMNLCSLGNVVDHVHWHLFPRYEADENFKNPPWLQMAQFESARVTLSEARQNIEKLQKEIQNLLSSVS